MKVIAALTFAGVPCSKAFTAVSPIARPPIRVDGACLEMSRSDSNVDHGNDRPHNDRREFLAAMAATGVLFGASVPAQATTLDPKKKYYREAYFEESRDVFRSPALRAKLKLEREALARGEDVELIKETIAEQDKEKADAAYEAKQIASETAAKERETQVLQAEQAAEEEIRRLEVLASKPPEEPRVLVLGGTGTVGRAVRADLEQRGIFVLATSRDGRDGTIALDVTKSFGKVADDVAKLTKDNRISAVVSCIGGVNTGNDAQINGASAQAALGARNSRTVRNFVALGASPSLYVKTPENLEVYVKTKEFTQKVIENKFVDDDKSLKYSYTIINPGAIGKSKNYGSDPTVPLKTVVDAVTVGALGYYLDEQPEILNSIDAIKAKAKKIEKVNQSFVKQAKA